MFLGKLDYGEIGIILAVGALFYIGYQSTTTNSAVIGAVRMDPCSGLLGLALTNCRKTNPQYNPKTHVYSGPDITPNVQPGSIREGGGRIGIAPKSPSATPTSFSRSDDWEKKCETMAQEIAKYLLQRKVPNMELIMQKYRKFGYTEKDYLCGKRRAEKRVQKNRLTYLDDETIGYPTDPAPGRQARGLESTDRPANSNPLGQLVNGIAEWFQSIVSGKPRTLIGGTPIVAGPRVITPIA